MRLNLKSLGVIGLLGGISGAINAWLCLAKLPVPVDVTINVFNSTLFQWHLIPAGFAHGALLAVIAVWFSTLVWSQSALVRWILLPVVGWLSGWISYIPLDFSLVTDKGIIFAHLFWPLRGGDFKEAVFGLWQYFGIVSAVYYLCLNLGRRLSDRRLIVHLAIATLSGSLGSLWWWIEFKPWYFSVIHGMIWGSLVGFGVWKSQREILSRVDPVSAR